MRPWNGILHPIVCCGGFPGKNPFVPTALLTTYLPTTYKYATKAKGPVGLEVQGVVMRCEDDEEMSNRGNGGVVKD